MENKYYNENYYNANTVLKFLRKVLNEINKSYVDSGMRTAFLMKRYIEKYKIDQEHCHEHVLLCMLKDIGLFYMDGAVPSNDPALAAASSYAFLHQCSPLDANARPLLFYKAKYMEDVNNPDYDMGLLMTLLYQVSLYIYQRKDVEEIEEILREDRKRKIYNPDQVKKVIKLLKDSPDIIEKLNSESELYVYETSRYISLANYGTDTLGEFLDTTSFMFEFHNHETMAHTVTTAQIAYDLAIACKLTESTSRAIEIAGKVHDIGKIRVPLEILCFPGKLEGEALAEMQNHAKYTKEIIEGCFSYVIVEIASRHHEKLDGSGYPLGITKKDLTSADKVLAVADICSALYCKRSYKAAFTPEKIQAILLSDAKAGKLDERIVNHLIDDYDRIMGNAKAVEDIALKKYETMKDEYEALAKSPALRHVFGESEDLDSERPESIAAEETEEYISDVIKYDMKKESDVEEQIIYVDENGNEIDYNPEEDELYSDDPEEALFGIEEEKKLDPLEEYNQAEMGDVPIEEIKTDDDLDEEEEEPTEEVEAPVFDLNPKEEIKEEESPKEEQESIDDEFDAFLNSIPEVEEDPFKDAPKKKPFVPKAPLKHPHVDFDPFKEDIDPVFQEPILPKEETKEDIDLEFDAFLNSIPEVKEDPFKEDETIEESIEEPNLELDVEDNQEEIEEEREIEESIELEEETKEIDDTIDESESEEVHAEEIDDSIEETEESSEELEEEETGKSDNDPFEDEEEIDDSLEESPNDAINSKYEETDEEIDSAIEEDEEEEPEEEKEEDYVTSYVDEEDIDLIEDENPSDSIIPDESKYDVDPDEEIDSSTDESIETEEAEVPESKEEKEDEFEEESEAAQEEDKTEEVLESKEDDYVTSYVDEDEFEEENESKDEKKEAIEEEDYVTSYIDEDEFEEEPKEIEESKEEPEVESKEDDYVTSYVDEDEFEEENNAPQVESKEPEPKIESKSDDESDEDDEDDEDDEEDDDDEDDDEDEDDSIEDDEEEEEDKDPKHKKFFSNDIYRKMFTYNPNKKKK